MLNEPTHTPVNTDHFATYSRPELAELLAAIGLDIVYEQADGDILTYRNEAGEAIEVLDMLGGFGAGLFGHNHPALVARAQQLLTDKRPFLAQGSIRSATGELAKRLSDWVGQTTDKSYVTTLANSGTEAVEAALKHATYSKVEAAEAIMRDTTHAFRTLRLGLRNGLLQVPADLFRSAETLLDVDQIDSLEQLEFCLTRHNEAVLMGHHCFLALSGAFHGKTTGSLKLTFNKDFRLPWQHIGLRNLFTPVNDRSRLAKTVAAERTTFVQLAIESGQIWLEERPWSNIVACLIEPIQGEGGIHPLTPEFLQAVRQTADDESVVLIIDEIQSGMGRTGRFLASADIRGDIYTFSKSLGGSLAKIGAMLVESEQYIKPFGYLHSSTFADDDFSSEIALTALELLEADDQALIKRCGEMGRYLLNRLAVVQNCYPDVIVDVRGQGLMVGIELANLENSSGSPLMNVAAEQHMLGFLLCGYLLHEHQIRVTPTISATNTIRIEPSACIQKEDIDRFCKALLAGVALISSGNAGDFLRYLTKSDAPAGASVQKLEISNQTSSRMRRVACIAHFIEPEDLVDFDPSLGKLSRGECSRLLAQTQTVLEPFIVGEQIIQSGQGDRVCLTIIGIPYTAEQIEKRMRNGETKPVLDAIKLGVELAKELGCIQIGFTGYISIVTQNCTAIIEDRVGLTSGNSLTAAAASEALHHALDDLELSNDDVCLGIVGGVGNIGRVLALVEQERVGRILLCGKRGRRRLEKLADEIYAQAWQQVCQLGDQAVSPERAPTGIAKSLKLLTDQGRIQLDQIPTVQQLAQTLGDDAPIQVSTDLTALRNCQAIISATNSAEPIITAKHLNHEWPTVICDVAVPNDVEPNLGRSSPDVQVIKGGLLCLPNGQKLDFPGLALPAGQAYACVSEVILLGFASIGDHFSYGALRLDQVREVRQLAKVHHFKVMAKTG